MASKKVDTTLVVLREIRDAVKATNGRVDHLAARVDHLATELHTTNERVEDLRRYVPEMEIRLATAITSMVGAVREAVREERDARFFALEQRLAAVERKVS